MSRINKKIIFFTVLILTAGFASWTVFYSTPQGLGLSDDSIAYIAGARSLLQGTGYRELWLASGQPVTHLPPGLSGLLAAVGVLTGLDPLRGFRLVNGLLFGANTFLLGVIGWQMTGSRIAGLILAFFFMSNASLVSLHTDAMSEPLYLFLTLLVFIAFALYIRTSINVDHLSASDPMVNVNYQRGIRWLVLSACLTGLAYLTRYAGLALLAALLMVILITHRTWVKRMKAAGFLLVGFMPWLIAWSMRNRILGGTTTNRAFQWHPITAENFEIAIYNISEFLVPIEEIRRAFFRIPGFFPAILVLAGLALISWLVFIAIRAASTMDNFQPETHSLLNGLFAFSYLSSVVVAMTFFDASTKFRNRILAPIYMTVIVLMVALGMWLWNRRARWLRMCLLAIAALLLSLSVMDSVQVMADLRRGGRGYASFQWYDSKAMAFLRSQPSDLRIYTNEPGAVYLYINRGAYVLPTRTDPVTAADRPGFAEGVTIVQEQVNSGEAVLALFDGGETLPEDTDILTEGLYLAHKSAGDEIYTAPGSP